MTRGVCADCFHSRMALMFGNPQLVCGAETPRAVLVPAGPGNATMIGVWPPVSRQDSCSQFYSGVDAQ